MCGDVCVQTVLLHVLNQSLMESVTCCRVGWLPCFIFHFLSILPLKASKE